MSEIRFTAEAVTEITAGPVNPPRATIIGYTGDIMRVEGFSRVVVELTGLKFGDRVNILADHNATVSGVIGHGIASTDGRSLKIDATLIESREAVRQIVEAAKAGIDWKASIGVDPGIVEYIREGQTITANGRQITAPKGGFKLVKTGTLREVSILALSADNSTSVTIAANVPLPEIFAS